MLGTGDSLNSMITSPGRRSGFRGGGILLHIDDQDPGLDWQPVKPDDAAMQRHVLAGDADEGAAELAVLDEPAGDELGGIDGCGETYALRGPDDGGIDADDAAA